jgi:uncharacterized protein YkwD
MKPNFLFATLTNWAVFISLTSFLRFNSDIVEDILIQTNNFRKSKGLPALIIRDDLNAIAQKHSENMASGRTKFGHNGIRQREQEAQKKITTLTSFAENVAYGANSGVEVVTMWKNSPGHRSNMLGDYKYIGIGTATDRRGQIYFTQVFVD